MKTLNLQFKIFGISPNFHFDDDFFKNIFDPEIFLMNFDAITDKNDYFFLS
jgi:hypothetical protein